MRCSSTNYKNISNNFSKWLTIIFLVKYNPDLTIEKILKDWWTHLKNILYCFSLNNIIVTNIFEWFLGFRILKLFVIFGNLAA